MSEKVECMTYEDWLRANPEIGKSSLNNFPFTDQCFWGGDCQKHDCERGFYIKKGKKCLLFEQYRTVWEAFGELDDYDDPNYHIFHGDSINWTVTINLSQDYTKGEAYRFNVVQYSQYQQIRQAELICSDVGMKRSKLLIANQRNLSLLRKYLTEIRDKIPEIMAAAEKRYTCAKCGGIDDIFSSLYNDRCVCDSCVPKIMDEYFS